LASIEASRAQFSGQDLRLNLAWPSFFVLPFIFSVLGTAQESASTIKVDVKLVNVFVTVTDEHDAPVGGLQSENFELKEDGQEQKIAVFQRESELPLSIVLAIDASLSVRKDLKLELLSARKFVALSCVQSTRWHCISSPNRSTNWSHSLPIRRR